MDENKPETQKTTEAVESATIGKLVMALAKAQGQIKAAPKDSDNPFFKSKYADLASVWEACREPLAKNGLAVIQRPNHQPDHHTGARVGRMDARHADNAPG